jgi:hypothetical protein
MPSPATGSVPNAVFNLSSSVKEPNLRKALIELGIPREKAQFYVRGVNQGCTLIIVRTSDERAAAAQSTMRRMNIASTAL